MKFNKKTNNVFLIFPVFVTAMKEKECKIKNSLFGVKNKDSKYKQKNIGLRHFTI